MTAETRHTAFLLWPGCHPAIVMPALAVLRSANRMAEALLYQTECFTLDDQPILSPEGWQLPGRRSQAPPPGMSQMWLVADVAK